LKKLAVLLIVVGIAVFLFPMAREYFYDREQNDLLREIENQVDSELKSPIRREFERLDYVFRQEELGATSSAPSAIPEEDRPEDLSDAAIAVIEIDKIDLKLPVLEGATTANMKIGAAHMKETAPLGEIGNAAVAAHRARTKGRQFNRLGEVEIGDRIGIRTRDGSFTYVVDKIKVVEPTDLSVLESNGKDAELTLITCDPIVKATHRLIVHAVLAEN